MPPNLGRIPIQTLACGAVIIGGAVAVVSGAIAAGATAIGVGTAAVLTGLVGSLSGLAGEVAGNDLAEFAQQFRPSAEVLRNHDLTKAVGMAIAVVIKHAATNSEFHSYKEKLDKLAQIPGKHHGQTLTQAEILDASFSRLSPDLQILLLNLTVYQRPFHVEAATALVGQEVDVTHVEEDLKQLVRRSLLQLQDQRDANGELLFGFQEQVLKYAKQKAGDLTAAHERAILYYTATAKEPPWTTDDDLTAYFEALHHRCELKQYDRPSGCLLRISQAAWIQFEACKPVRAIGAGMAT